MQQVNRRSNNRANTIISQSFIASEFQGFNDPFVNTMPTSALNQLSRSKPISNSGFFQQNQNQQSFGFNNISPSNVIQIDKEIRSTQQTIRVGNPSTQTIQSTSTVSNNFNQQSNYSNQPIPQVFVQNNIQNQPLTNINQQSQQQRSSMTLLPPQQQQFLNQNNQYQDRYVSPMIMKVDSPTKRPSSSFGQPQQLSQFNQQQSFTSQQVPQQQQIPQQQQQQSQVQPTNQQPNISNQQKRAVNNTYQQQSQQFQQSQQQNFGNISKQTPQTSNSKVTSIPIKQSTKESISQIQSMNLQLSEQITKSLSNPSLLQSNINKTTTVSQSNSMKRLKLNVSQQFSNSFTLECIKQPQRSNIIEMKKRQRQFRKSIQNFFI